MIDIHSHIIFGVDDGAKTLADSIELLKESRRQGVKAIIATPHRRKDMFDIDMEIVQNNFNILKEEAAKNFPDIDIYLGSEVYYKEGELENIENKKYPTLAGTDYLLIEYNYGISYRELERSLKGILLLGLTPIIAHIERYECLAEDPNRVANLLNLGCYTQVNAASVLKTKMFGDKHKTYKKRAKYYLDNNFVNFIATDMHNMKNRKPHLLEAYNIIEKKYGEDVAYDLFIGNQKRLLNNKIV